MPRRDMRHKHPRLRGYDYTRMGAYFVTICTHERAHLYGRVVDPPELAAEPFMDLNDAGAIVQRCWDAIPGHYLHVELDAFQVMPNHVHGIIVIVASPHGATVPTAHGANVPTPYTPPNDNTVVDPDGSGHAPTVQIVGSGHANDPGGSGHAPTLRGLGNIVGSFKSAVSKGVNELRGTPGAPVWQKGYHDRIIRDDAEHDRIAQYIAENPANWTTDPNNI